MRRAGNVGCLDTGSCWAGTMILVVGFPLQSVKVSWGYTIQLNVSARMWFLSLLTA